MSFEVIQQVRAAQGILKRIQFTSSSLGGTKTTFGIYLPDTTESRKLPALYWLSGLTCNDENFAQKAGAFQSACSNQVVLVMPDTSPRGDGVPDEDPHAWDFGIGAGFYLNAKTAKYKQHYNMYDFIVKELPMFVEANFPVTDRRSISGHSMGGHGALTIAMKNPDRYASVSAFAPICNPMVVPWGTKAFKLYIGDDQKDWEEYDATELIKVYKGRDLHILCDCGTTDGFLVGDVDQLTPLNFIDAALKAKIPVTFRFQGDFDHSYYFISTFIGEHLAHHARYLHSRL